jgi:glycosyltransferase involved in cell wall biosynthesis
MTHMVTNLQSPKTISIITICLNSAKTIDATIESVLSQGQEQLEYIIVDGGSTDGTQDIIRSFGESIKVFVSEPDKGISDAFNKGIALSSGKIIGIINSDDILLPGAIDMILSYFLEHPDVQIIHGDVLLYENGIFIKRIKPPSRWWFPWRLVVFNHPATFVRKEVYERCGTFKQEYRVAMDVEIYLRWIKAGVKIYYLPESLVNMTAGGASGRRALVGYSETKRAFIEKGFSRPVVNLLYIARLLVHFIAKMQSWFKRKVGYF